MLWKEAILQKGSEAQTAKAEYEAAAKKLSMFIFGQDVGKEFYDKLDDMEWCAGKQVWDEETKMWGTIFPTTALDPSEGGVVIDDESKWIDVPLEVTTTDPVTGEKQLLRLTQNINQTSRQSWMYIYVKR